ncbi:MAG: DUF1573 domain-containing protein [bacterium]|nr:DUF1573 domain-containing protein [bacterium]
MQSIFLKINIKIILVIIVLATGAVGGFWLVQKNNSSLSGQLGSALIAPVSAEEIYPMFLCACCGIPLDKNKICCEMAQERIDFIDSLAGQGILKEEIILAYAKKYGLNSFADKEKQEEFKEKLVAAAPDNRPIISLSPESFDFGDVSQKNGVVTTLFEIKNEGKADLIIDKLDSSCGCTSASVIFQGVEGPRFAMAGHGIESPKDWKITIPAGQTAQLKVYYDPSVHADFRGYAIREISVFSNDPIDFERKVIVELTQTD